MTPRNLDDRGLSFPLPAALDLAPLAFLLEVPAVAVAPLLLADPFPLLGFPPPLVWGAATWVCPLEVADFCDEDGSDDEEADAERPKPTLARTLEGPEEEPGGEASWSPESAPSLLSPLLPLPGAFEESSASSSLPDRGEILLLFVGPLTVDSALIVPAVALRSALLSMVDDRTPGSLRTQLVC